MARVTRSTEPVVRGLLGLASSPVPPPPDEAVGLAEETAAEILRTMSRPLEPEELEKRPKTEIKEALDTIPLGPDDKIEVNDWDTGTLVAFAQAIFPPEVYAKIAGRNPAKRIREYFQGYYTGNQCAGALAGTGREFRPGTSLCWICGFVIPFGAQKSGQASGFSYECEHVFPITQAMFFTDLYRGKKAVNASDKAVLALEYDHAHRVCNQVKNNDHFLVSYSGSQGREWYVDRRKIEVFLRKLWNNTGFYGPPDEGKNLLQLTIGKNVNQWIKIRTDVIAKRCQAILDATVGVCREAPGIFMLASIARCTEDRPIRPASPSTEESDGPPNAKKRKVGSARKTRRRRRRTTKTRRHLPN